MCCPQYAKPAEPVADHAWQETFKQDCAALGTQCYNRVTAARQIRKGSAGRQDRNLPYVKSARCAERRGLPSCFLPGTSFIAHRRDGMAQANKRQNAGSQYASRYAYNTP